MHKRNNYLASAITDILLNAASGNPSGNVVLVTSTAGGGSGFGGASKGGQCVTPSQC